MVIVLDEKLPPPPPYAPPPPAYPVSPISPTQATSSQNPFRRPNAHRNRQYRSFSDLPAHILLHVVYSTFPPSPRSNRHGAQRSPTELAYHRQILYWIEMNLRLVNRATYVACMNVLRSVYLPSYASMVRRGYSSDPFPLATPTGTDTTSGRTELISLQRETAVLDLFIAAKVREDVWLDETELHLEREETFKDLFDLNQPRARIEDLVRHFGTQSGSIYTTPPSTPASSPSSTPSPEQRGSLPFRALSVSFSPRQASLLLTTSSRKRTIAVVERRRNESLENVAARLVKELDRTRANGLREWGG